MSASLGLITLEQNLLDDKPTTGAGESNTTRWPYGSKRQAEDLKRAGFTVVSLANNHTADYGVDGIMQTRQILEHENLLPVGSGGDLGKALAPVFVGVAPRRLAIIAVTTSASPESRATESHGDILGRPGANVLRYAPHITVDPATFATLSKSAIATHSAGNTARDQLTLSGTVIHRGPKTSVEFTANERDTENILSQIKQARSEADVVVVMLHSHEPSDQVDAPPDFVKRFARSAIDAGAVLVAGDGAHRLRGIECYHQGVIFYGLGNFAFESATLDPSSFDIYDRGFDMLQFSLGAMGNAPSSPAQLEDNVWWQSVVAITTLDHGAIHSIQLYPIDLGAGSPSAQRGIPRLATAEVADGILRRFSTLSEAFGTRIRIDNGQGSIDLGQQKQ